MILERYREHEQASMTVTTRLIQMGLVHLVSPPDRPGEVMLDSQVLQQLLSLYGPKVTTSSGYSGRLRDAGRDLDSPVGGEGLCDLDPGVGSGSRQKW